MNPKQICEDQPTYLQFQVDATTSPKNTDACKQLAVAYDTTHEEDPQVLDHFVARAMTAQDTPDEVRANLDMALQTLSLLIREYPTLPADPQDPTHHLTYSKRSDCALKLRIGASHDDLLLHVQEQHHNVLQPIITS